MGWTETLIGLLGGAGLGVALGMVKEWRNAGITETSFRERFTSLADAMKEDATRTGKIETHLENGLRELAGVATVLAKIQTQQEITDRFRAEQISAMNARQERQEHAIAEIWQKLSDLTSELRKKL